MSPHASVDCGQGVGQAGALRPLWALRLWAWRAGFAAAALAVCGKSQVGKANVNAERRCG